MARSGKEVTLKSRKITIYSIKLIYFKLPHAVLDIRCSKGTYIRSLINDIAKKLDTQGTMSALIRLSSSGFSIKQTVHPETLNTSTQLLDALLPIDHLLSLPKFDLTPFEYQLVSHGTIPNRIQPPALGIYQLFFNNQLKSIIEFDGQKVKFSRQFHLEQ